jgi:hypothetical protein
MALNDLTGQRIKNTYERLVQTEGGQYADVTGSLLDIASTADIPSTSSLLTTASAAGNIITFEKGDGSEFEVTVTTASLAGYATEAYVLSQTSSLSASLAVDIAQNASDIGDLETSASNALTTASVSLNTITFTKGDGSTFPITVDTGSGGVAPGEVVDSLNGLSGSLTLATADSDTLSITETDSSTITLEALPQRKVTATVKNVSGGTLTKGTPVHATASASPPAGNVSEVVAAEAQSQLLMPATYVLDEDLDDGEEGQGVLIGFVNGLNTSTFVEGQVIYVANGGGFTGTKPTGADKIQNLGVVQKVDNTNGSIEVLGSGRANDVPNMGTGGKIFYSNADGSTNVVTLADQTISSSLTANTASYVEGSNVDGAVETANTASYVVTAQTASYVAGANVDGAVANATNAVDATNADNVAVQAVASASPFVALVNSTGDNPIEVDQDIKYIVADDRLEVPNILSPGGDITLQDGDLSVTGSIAVSGSGDALIECDGEVDITGNGDVTITSGQTASDKIILDGKVEVAGPHDFEIKDGDFIMVGTADITGNTTIDGNLTMEDNHLILFNSDGIGGKPDGIQWPDVTNWGETSDHTATGQTLAIGALTSVTAGNFYVRNGASWSAVANTSDATTIGLLGYATSTATTNRFVIKGICNVRSTEIEGSPAIGRVLYVGTSGGHLTATEPSTSGRRVRRVGQILDSYVSGRLTYYKIWFDPDWYTFTV